MMFDIPKLSGQVELNLLQYRDTSKTWEQLRDDLDLDQDLLQVVYPNGLVLDAGWYEDSQLDSATVNVAAGGAFRVVLVRNLDWQRCVVSIYARDFNELRTAIEAVDHLASLFPT